MTIKRLMRGLAVLFAALALVAAIGLGWRALRQYQLSEAMSIRTPNGIDERRFVRIGGVEQWITIRGQNRANPAILLLHGGPGAPLSALPRLFLPWEQHFTIVQWDQRGAGKSYNADKTPPSSIELMVNDAVEVTEYARRRLHRDRVILLGHSWGSVLGIHVLRARPDLFDAWVGTGQIVNMGRNEIVAYAQVLSKARSRGDRNAVEALEKSGAPPYGNIRQMGLQRRWAMQYEPGLHFRFPFGPLDLLRDLLTVPGYSFKDVGNYVKGEMAGDAFFGETLHGPLMQEDLAALGTSFPVPFFIVEGAEDDITPASLARVYFDEVSAPRKAFLVVPEAGHLALMTQPAVFLSFLLKEVRPAQY
jgi:pimeloyl-ACP methyl ester carboxylesterase